MPEAKTFPWWRYHAIESPCIVHSAEEDAALGPGWADHPDHLQAPVEVEPQPQPAVKTKRKPK